MADIYNIDVKDSANSNISMSEFAGKTLLIVNVASKCGLTPVSYTHLTLPTTR